MRSQLVRVMWMAAASGAVAACGGGSGAGERVASIPPPAPAPPPALSPPPPPPIPAGPIGLQSNAAFKTQAAYWNSGSLSTGPDLVQFSYSAATNSYTITLPGFQPGQLVTTGGNGSYLNSSEWQTFRGTNNAVTVGSTSEQQPGIVVLDWPASSTLSYTSLGEWYGHSPDNRHGLFAYGIPTAGSDMPLTGAASYNGSVRGFSDSGIPVDGSVSLSFDFGAGTLSGSMKPELLPWDVIPLGTYTFRDTVYSSGSTSFSGAFNVPGSTGPSSFSGNFNGPQAAEFMANWQAPYVIPSTNESGTMAGVWTGKKD